MTERDWLGLAALVLCLALTLWEVRWFILTGLPAARRHRDLPLLIAAAIRPLIMLGFLGFALVKIWGQP